MDTAESFEHYNAYANKADWNNWAEKLLQEKRDCIETGCWAEKCDDWAERAELNFSSETFKESAEFSDLIFPSNVQFSQTTFENEAAFHGSTFFGDCDFSGAVCKGDALFNESHFKGKANFQNVTFQGNARFTLSQFDAAARFEDAIFQQETDFNSSQFASMFNIDETCFHSVPGFIQTNFAKPPRLDRVKLDSCLNFTRQAPENETDPRSFEFRGWRYLPQSDAVAYWMALKKIAADSLDHSAKTDFFANELLARRFWYDKPGKSRPGRFWGGCLYQLLSDSGRSFARPVTAWALNLVALSGILAIGKHSSDKWHSTIAPELYFSLINSIPGFGLVRESQRALLIKILLGTSDKSLHAGWEIVFTLHALAQMALVFLFLLAVRNHFKIE